MVPGEVRRTLSLLERERCEFADTLNYRTLAVVVARPPLAEYGHQCGLTRNTNASDIRCNDRYAKNTEKHALR